MAAASVAGLLIWRNTLLLLMSGRYFMVKELKYAQMDVRDQVGSAANQARNHRKGHTLTNCYRRQVDSKRVLKEHSMYLPGVDFNLPYTLIAVFHITPVNNKKA